MVKQILILTVFTLLACVWLFPLPLHFSDGLLEAQSGDPLLQIWVVQWNIHKLTTSLANYFDANIFYPYPNTFAFHDHLFALGVLGLPVYLVTHNPILTYNVLFMLSFILSAYGMYLLCRELTGNSAAAFIAGGIFGFLPYRFAHLDHLNLLSIQWLPFCFLFLMRAIFSRTHTTRNLWLFWAFFLLQALTSFNYLFMMFLAVGIAIMAAICVQWKDRQSPFRVPKNILIFLLGGCCVGLLLLPLARPYLRANSEMNFQRTVQETRGLSARIWDYAAAPERNLLYGKITRRFQNPTSPFPREQMLFYGICPTILAFIGILGKKKRAVRLLYVALFVVALVLSFGPSFEWFGKTFSLPYAWLYEYFPGFKSMRVPARFGVLASFALTVCAAYGVSDLNDYLKTLRRFTTFARFSILGILGGIVLLEYASLPKPLIYYPATMAAIPQEYQWLAQQPEDVKIVELPGISARANFEYMYYSSFHWKRLLNGRSAFIPNGVTQILAELQDFPSARTVELLQSLGIQYVLFHAESTRLPQILPEGVHIFQTFDKTIVLKIDQPSQPQTLTPEFRVPLSLRPAEDYTAGIVLQPENTAVFSPLPYEKIAVKMEWTNANQVITREVVKLPLPAIFERREPIILSLPLRTPAQLEDYRVKIFIDAPFVQPNILTRRLTLIEHVADSRQPEKLQAEFLRVDLPEVWQAGKLLPVKALVKNSGNTLWKARVADRKQPVGEVHLGIRDWQDAVSKQSLQTTQPELFVSRGFLAYDVAPGQEIWVTATLKTPPQPGNYVVTLDLVSELIQWFSDQGSPRFSKNLILK